MREKQKYPLRKIVDEILVTEPLYPGAKPRERLMEVLECGHRQLPVKDIYGKTNAYRRRCKQCYKAEQSKNEGGVNE